MLTSGDSAPIVFGGINYLHFRSDAGYWLSETSCNRIYSVPFSRHVSPIQLRGRPPVHSGLTISADGKYLAFTRLEKGKTADQFVEQIKLLQADDGHQIGSIVCGSAGGENVFQKSEPALAFSPDGKRLMIGGVGTHIEEQELPAGRLVHLIELQGPTRI